VQQLPHPKKGDEDEVEEAHPNHEKLHVPTVNQRQNDSTSNREDRPGGNPTLPELPPDSANVTEISNQPGAYLVKIPEGIRGGMSFPITIHGKQLAVICPNMARPGMSVRIVPPPLPVQQLPQPKKDGGGERGRMFEVIVP